MTTVEHLGLMTTDHARLRPESVALVQGGDRITYASLEQRADRVAGWLVGHGVEPGQRVGLMWSNDIRYVECFLGVLRSGAVAVPLNVRQSDDTLAYTLGDADTVGILAGENWQARADELVPTGARRFVAGAAELQEATALQDRPVRSPTDVCMLPYTSGSTGRPKGVPLTHRGQLWCADMVRKCYLFDESERALLFAPLFHKNAAVTLKAMLLAGGCCVVLPEFDAVAVIEAIDRHGITYLSGVPAMYRLMLGQEDVLARCDVSSVRFATAASASVGVDLLEDFGAKFGAPIAEGYGLTEGGPDVLLTPRWGMNRLGSLGIPLPGCEVELRDADGRAEVPVGEVGELWVRNPGVTPGYHRLPEVTAERIRDGWLATRDLMRRDADGYHYFVGRQDDLISVGGENVYPKEVEVVLGRHPDVQEAVVVGAPHPVKGAVPVAFVVLRPAATVTAADLTVFFHSVGPHDAYPRVIEFVDVLPLVGAGKTDRTALTARARRLVEA